MPMLLFICFWYKNLIHYRTLKIDLFETDAKPSSTSDLKPEAADFNNRKNFQQNM